MAPELERARYISLVTFRRDGRAVATPVWCVAFGGKLYCYTHRDMGKAKRIRATGRVEAAPSDGRGRPLGAYSTGTGRIVSEPDLEQRVYAELAAKYGIPRVFSVGCGMGAGGRFSARETPADTCAFGHSGISNSARASRTIEIANCFGLIGQAFQTLGIENPPFS